MRIFKFQVLFAAALFMSLFTVSEARAIILSIDIGTITFGGPGFGGGPPPIGSGTLTGGFKFDTDTRIASEVAFEASGTTGGHDGIYDTPLPSIISATNLRVFRDAEPFTSATSVLSLNFSSLAPGFPLVPPLNPILGGNKIGASNVVLGKCAPLPGLPFAGPCTIILVDNNTAILATQNGPGVSAVPLPAALPLFGSGLAIMGFIGWRRKSKVS